jgi:hypothetical protein
MESFAAAAANALANVDATAPPADAHLVLEQNIIDGNTVVETWHIQIANGTAQVIDGPADNPDVTMRQDRSTALALQSGELHTQQAFLTGRLTIDGDIPKLLEHGDLLQNLLRGGDA